MAMATARRGMSRGTLSLGVALGLFALGTAAQAAEFTMKLGSSSADDAESNYLAAMKAAIEPASSGRIEVQLYPRNQLGSQSAVIQGLQLGTVEGIHIPADFFAGVDPRMGVLSFPFLFKDRKHANRVLADLGIQKTLDEMLDAKGIVGCGPIATADVRYMLRSGIHKLADFQGKKLRINGTDAERERFKRLGATSVPMNLPDMITAFAKRHHRWLGLRYDHLGQLQARQRFEGSAADRRHSDPLELRNQQEMARHAASRSSQHGHYEEP
jgi:TRAP-type C4-dicarboxylate transport system substrate-binding protein